MEPTNQKEYLKKYLSGKDGKKKKRKKKEIVGERLVLSCAIINSLLYLL